MALYSFIENLVCIGNIKPIYNS